ncbi:MAG: chemotaxis protein CheA [Melioribacteraceae bacterium]|nr:chemotaxis protein CheA [Melioribacteraceae bacterium]
MLNDPEMQEIFQSFLVETKEILEQLDLDLVEIEKRPDDVDLLNQIFRSFHTIKGTSGFLGLEKLQKVTHRGEDILNKLRKGEVLLNDEIMDNILKSYDAIKDLVDVIEEKKEEDFDTSEILYELDTLIAKLENKELPVQEVKKSKPTKTTKAKKTKTAKTTKAKKSTVEKSDEAITESEDEIIESVEIPEMNEVSTHAAMSQKEDSNQNSDKKDDKSLQHGKKGENTIRVDVQRLDELLNIVSELVLGRNRLAQINIEAGIQYEGTKISRDLAETTRQIDLMTTELQLAVMKTRMIKIAKVFNRFPRLVRDLSKDLGREVQLIIQGEDTELDKTLIEEINDPLVHLVRNSIDHGIETPEDRKALGKPELGTVTLSAEHEGNNIIISIEDDGKGIDTEAIKEKAIQKGIISADKANELSKQDIFNLIFAPGFSTAKKVTNVSGRGVGMDVVKTNVAKLRGIINIESEVNKGTKIIIKLPLTLAIIQGLLVKVAGETVVVPLNSVIEVVRVPITQIYSVKTNECIKLRESVLPLIDIDEALYGMKINDIQEDWQYVVVVGIAEKRYGLKVNELVGQKEVVIKSLGSYIGNIDGVAGSTIMGDGKVVMILDIAEMVNKIMVHA